MTNNERNSSYETDPSEEEARIKKELESIRDRFADTLHLLMPGVDHHLLTLAYGGWPHTSELEHRILDWLEGVLLSSDRTGPKQQTLLEDGEKVVHVLAQHLLDDYW